MEHEPADGPVLVAVAELTHVQQLVRTAGDLARHGSGEVRLVTVVVKSHDSPFGVFEDETILREFAGDSLELLERATPPPGVTVERDAVVARSVARGLLAAVDDCDPDALVVGWQPRSRRSDAVLGTSVDRLVERAPCDLYVERIGREANGVDSVLLPVAGGPHVVAAATAAAAIAAGNDATVHVVTVDTDDDAAADHDAGADDAAAANDDAPANGDTAASDNAAASGEAAAFVEEGRRAVLDAPGPTVPVETAVLTGENVTEALVPAAGEHDVVVFGATRQGALRRRLVGSVPRRVMRRTETTIILARDGDVVGGPLDRLGGLLRR